VIRISIGYTIIAVMLIPFAVFVHQVTAESAQINGNITFLLFLIVPSTLSAVILWLWMVADYLTNNNKLRHKGLWGWGLFLGNWFASMVYFLTIYVPRIKAEGRTSRQR